MLRRIAVLAAVILAAGCGDSARVGKPDNPAPQFDKSVDQKKVGEFTPGP